MDKKQLLLKTALKLFVENGFHGTATARIAKEANVANGTLFQHFSKKEELIVALFKEVKEDMAKSLTDYQVNKPVKDLLWVQFTTSIQWALKNTDKFQYLQQFYNSPFIHLMEQADLKKYVEPHLNLIRRGVEEGIIKDIEIDLIYQLFSSQTFGVIQYLVAGKMNKQGEVIEKTFILLWNMIKA